MNHLDIEEEQRRVSNEITYRGIKILVNKGGKFEARVPDERGIRVTRASLETMKRAIDATIPPKYKPTEAIIAHSEGRPRRATITGWKRRTPRSKPEFTTTGEWISCYDKVYAFDQVAFDRLTAISNEIAELNRERLTIRNGLKEITPDTLEEEKDAQEPTV